MPKRISYKEMIAHNKLDTYIQQRTQEKVKQEIYHRLNRCRYCGRLVVASLHPEVCNRCQAENGD